MEEYDKQFNYLLLEDKTEKCRDKRKDIRRRMLELAMRISNVNV